MKANWRVVALVGAIMLQLLVLAGELLGAVYPRWWGQAVHLAVQPVDPRSLFRGNYARLRYAIGEVQLDRLPRTLRRGEPVYVPLRRDATGLMQADGLSLEPPDDRPFIRGRVETHHATPRGVSVRLRYGIEAYFLPRDKALALEKSLRNSGSVASVMIAPNGKAALLGVDPGLPGD
jgi:uncharacterized membrane-anchored protein